MEKSDKLTGNDHPETGVNPLRSQKSHKSSTLCKFAKEFLGSGNQQLKATVSLVLESSPNSKSMESARMSTEMFLKAFTAPKIGLSEKDAKDNIGHDLTKALAACQSVDANSELKAILTNLKVFPDIADRYKGFHKTPKEHWRAYRLHSL